MQGDEPFDDRVDDAHSRQHSEEQEVEVIDDTEEMLPLEEQYRQMEHDLEDAKGRAEENWNKLLRIQAEQDNLRKRSQRDIENAHKYALEKFVNELLPVKDSLELGLSAAGGEGEIEKIRQGTELTLKMFSDVLAKFGVEEVDPVGEKFDPEHHQAMSVQENADLPPNSVLAVMQKGYLLNDRLVRPAMVVVSKAPA